MYSCICHCMNGRYSCAFLCTGQKTIRAYCPFFIYMLLLIDMEIINLSREYHKIQKDWRKTSEVICYD